MPSRARESRLRVNNLQTRNTSILGVGITSTSDEMNTVAGVTAGTATAGKALVTHGTTNSVTGLRRPIVSTAIDATLTTAQSGAVILVTAADKVITLPSTAAGLWYTIVLAAAALSTGAGLSISPAAADYIAGAGLTLVDNKDLILAGSGDIAGDFVTLVADGTNGWFVIGIAGIWTKE